MRYLRNTDRYRHMYFYMHTHLAFIIAKTHLAFQLFAVVGALLGWQMIEKV